MNKIIMLYLIAYLCWQPNSLAATKTATKQNAALLSLDFQQLDAKQILQALADLKQLNLYWQAWPSAVPISVHLHQVSWQQALQIVSEMAGVETEIVDNLLIVTPINQDDLFSDENFGLPQKPLQYLSLQLNHADVKELQNLIVQQNLLSERGRLFVDEKQNHLLIYDIASQFAPIQQLVAQFDQGQPQIHIAAYIVTMSSEQLSELGVRWGYQNSPAHFLSGAAVNLSAGAPTTQLNFGVAKLAGQILGLELSAMEAENQVEIVANPTLLTMNQHTASIKQGTEIPYEVSSGSNGATSIEFKQAVLGLEVTPKILNQSQLQLDLKITQNSAGNVIHRSDGGEALAIDTQEIETAVQVKSGETVVLGGILQQRKEQSKQQVPGLGNLPLLGGLFRHQAKSEQRRELVIFITPQLISRS